MTVCLRLLAGLSEEAEEAKAHGAGVNVNKMGHFLTTIGIHVIFGCKCGICDHWLKLSHISNFAALKKIVLKNCLHFGVFKS